MLRVKEQALLAAGGQDQRQRGVGSSYSRRGSARLGTAAVFGI